MSINDKKMMMQTLIGRPDNQPLISVIIPIYNAELYLNRCVDSVLAQDYTNLEIFLVDDGSTDKSGAIADSYAKSESRIHVIHQANSGVSASRNKALECYTGEYVIFVDADDWIEPNLCNALFNALRDNGISDVLVESTCNQYDEVGNSLTVPPQAIKRQHIFDIHSDFAFDMYNWGIIRSVLFPRTVIDGMDNEEPLRFHTDLYVAEDSLFYANAVKRAGKVIELPDRLYNYVIYDDSSSHGEMNEKRYTELISWLRIMELFHDNIRLYDICQGCVGIRAFWVLLKFQNSRKLLKEPLWKEKYKKALQIVRFTLPKVLSQRYSYKLKIKFIICAVSPNVYFLLKNICQAIKYPIKKLRSC